MLDFLKRKKGSPPPKDNTTNPSPTLFARFKQGLSRTRHSITQGLATVFLGKKQIDEALFEELEELLLTADMGVETTRQVIQALTQQVKRSELKDIDALSWSLREQLKNQLRPYQQPLAFSDSDSDPDPESDPSRKNPYVILMVGVNGTGKTTTIGKLAKKLKVEGKKILLAAGDTFRAAAIEQLQSWGEKNDIPVIAQHAGADSASVIFDALQAAKHRGVDILIADTAGRLHTQAHLMEELKKVIRVIKKLDETAPHEVMLVLDAGIGQNALVQAKKFHEAVGVTGITITKMDGTAKGGIIFNIANSLKLPIRFVGLGEGVEDLKPFDADAFVEALFTTDHERETPS